MQKKPCFNPRVLAGGRDWDNWQKFNGEQVSIHASSREDATNQVISTMPKSSFNPRVLAGGRDGQIFGDIVAVPVSIHASSREDATCPVIRTKQPDSGFNPRVLAGGRDVFRHFRTPDHTGFNPRVLAGGRDHNGGIGFYLLRFQSTRPRGRTRPLRIPQQIHIRSVSIHASSREDATKFGCGQGD